MSSWLASPERCTGISSSPTSSSILNSAWGMKTVDSVLGRGWVIEYYDIKKKQKMNESGDTNKKKGNRNQFLTISRVHNLYCGCVWKLQHSHDWLWELNLKSLRGLKLLVCEYLHLPCCCSLAWIELDLFLCLPTEVFVLHSCSIDCCYTWEDRYKKKAKKTQFFSFWLLGKSLIAAHILTYTLI